MAVINGTSGNNVLNGTTDADQINGLAGDDVINALSRATAAPFAFDVVDGGDGTDTLVVDASSETQAVQLMTGLSPRFSVGSASGNFSLDAYNMEVVKFTGGSGDDTINTGDSAGTVNGNGGIDWWIADLSGLFTKVVFTLGTTTKIAAAGLTSILGIERINLSTGAGNDTIIGGAQADSISTGDGDDIIDAKTRPTAGPIDMVDGGDGVDTLVVDASAETQSVSLSVGLAPTFSVNSTSGNFDVDAYNMEKVKFTGGSGNDTIDTGAMGVTVNGGGGIDHWLADLSGLSAKVTFTLGTTTLISAAGLTSILGIERITLSTGWGNDTITGGAQADTINTNDGDDTIDAKTRPIAGPIDVVDGGEGVDTLIVNASAETQSVSLSVGLAPTFSVNSTSGNFDVDAYNMEKVKFTGGSGNDTIDTGAMGVTVNGGAGMDHWLADLSQLASAVTFTLGTTTAISVAGLTSITGIEKISLTTGSGNDTITGGAQADTINTGDGNDVIDAKTRAGGIDVVDGGAGVDTLVVNASAETQSVSLSVGLAPTFSVNSDSGNFDVDAYNMEKVKFTGGSGNDTINTGAMGVTVDGRGGIDYWLANLSQVASHVTFELGTTTAIAAAGLTSILGIERIDLTTGKGNDTITGGAQADTITTGAGNDIINAKTRPTAGGIDVVDGGTGVDTLVVNASAETQSVSLSVGLAPTFSVNSDSGNFDVDAYNMEKVQFTGGSGADTINTGAMGVTVDGRGGIDHWLASLSRLTSDVTFELGTTTSIAAAGLTSILNIERIDLTTGRGNDTITGGAQADTINTGAGDDIINAKTRPVAGGIDVVDGGAGLDTLVVDASTETQSVSVSVGSSPTFSVNSTSGKFDVDAYNVERVVFTGGSGADTAIGNKWNDVLTGGNGADTLVGGLGNDILNGGNHADFLSGGRDADQLTGGAAADTFDYDAVADSSVLANKIDSITDFVSGVDKIDLGDIDANARAVDGNQAFAFIGAAAFSGVRGQLRSAGGLIQADLNGDKVADFQINLTNGATALVGDFIL